MTNSIQRSKSAMTVTIANLTTKQPNVTNKKANQIEQNTRSPKRHFREETFSCFCGRHQSINDTGICILQQHEDGVLCCSTTSQPSRLHSKTWHNERCKFLAENIKLFLSPHNLLISYKCFTLICNLCLLLTFLINAAFCQSLLCYIVGAFSFFNFAFPSFHFTHNKLVRVRLVRACRVIITWFITCTTDRSKIYNETFSS